MISVVIPTHNRSDLLQNAIQSVVNQTFKNIEIIVVDDASTCDNQTIVDSFDMPIIYHRFETNQGGNVCRNKGVELASGEYIAFLDDDDTWHPKKIEKQYKLMSEENIDMSYTGKSITTVNKELIELSQRYSFSKAKYQNIIKSIMYKNFIGTTSSILVKKERILTIGGFDEKMPAMQDYDLYIRFINAGYTVKGIDESLLNYYIYENSNAISKSFIKNFKASLILIKKYFLKYPYFSLIFKPLKVIGIFLKKYLGI